MSACSIFCSFTLGLFLTSGCRARAEIARRGSLELITTVYVFNSAHLGQADLIKAQMLAGRIFGKTGIKVNWVAGLTARRPDDQPTTEKWDRANLLLRIRKSPTIRGKRFNPEAVGFCLSLRANEAVVLLDRIQDRAAELNANPAVGLGVSMAHEMGHLLLQSETHSLAGIMKARWLADDLTAAESGTLTFTREQGRSMQNRVFANSIEKRVVFGNTNLADLLGLGMPNELGHGKANPLYRRTLAMIQERPELRTGEIRLGLRHFPAMLRKMKCKTEKYEI
jgi:hypothetical protein